MLSEHPNFGEMKGMRLILAQRWLHKNDFHDNISKALKMHGALKGLIRVHFYIAIFAG